MTREQREREVAEALEWMMEEDPPVGSGQKAECSKFPGWVVDAKVDGALLECILTIHPSARLVAVLAAMRMHWLPQGRTTTRAWRARLRNWCSARKTWDPLLSGHTGDGGTADRSGAARDQRRWIGRSSFRASPSPRPPVAMSDVVKAELARIKRITDG